MNSAAHTAPPWEKLLDGRFDSKHLRGPKHDCPADGFDLFF
jgi:hypothetical protein